MSILNFRLQKLAEQQKQFLLFCFGLFSALSYLFLVWNFFLPRFYETPLWIWHNKKFSGPLWTFPLLFIFLIVLYGFAYKLLQSSKIKFPLLRIIIVFGLLFHVILMFLHPIGANDNYDFLARIRMFIINNQNPYIIPAELITDNLWFKYVQFQDETLFYGPLLAFFWSLVLKMLNFNLLNSLLAIKVVSVALNLMCGFLIYKIAKILKPQIAEISLFLFLWNPFILHEAIGNSHNDVFMLALFLISFLLLLRTRFILSLVFLTAAILIKFVFVVFVPIYLIYIFQKTNAQKFFWLMLLAFIFSLLLCVISFFPFANNFSEALTILNNIYLNRKNVFGNSLFSVFYQIGLLVIENPLGILFMKNLLQLIFVFLYIFLYFKILRQFWEKKQDLIFTLFRTIFYLLIFLAFAFAPWYFLWLMPLLILLNHPHKISLLFYITLTSLLYYWLARNIMSVSLLTSATKYLLLYISLFAGIFYWGIYKLPNKNNLERKK